MRKMLRPKAIVLPESAVVPERSSISPPPNRFTHEVVVAQPYYFSHAPSGAPAGEFAPHTKVALLRYEGGERCNVVDGRGLYVETSYRGLRLLEREVDDAL